MNWKDLNNEDQIEAIREESKTQPVVIFKHSTRCSISSMAKSRLERSDLPEGFTFYYLDLLAHRALSNKLAEVFSVPHQSPQVLIIKKGDCIYDESHGAISMDVIAAHK